MPAPRGLAVRDRTRGSLLVEAVIGLSLVCMACVANLELVRRSFYEVLLHHGAFLAVRGAVFGTPPSLPAQRFWNAALGTERAKGFRRQTDFSLQRYSDGVLVRAHFSYPSWFQFPLENGLKRSFEVTRKCHFVLSR